MANRDTPIGFRPAQGIGSQHIFKLFRVDSNNATNVFVGDVMDLDGEGVGPAAADAGVSAAGVCVALFDTNMISIGHPNSAVSTKYLPSSTAGWALVALAVPGAVFVCQDDASATLTNDDVGATADHVAGTGDTTTSRSRHELNATVGGLQFRILGLVKNPSNAWGANADLYVVFNESAFGCSGAASV